MNLLLLLVLTFHPAQWQATTHEDRSGQWQTVDGPAPQLDQRLMYDDQMKIWFIEEGSPHYWGWTPLRDGDRITVDEKGIVRVFAGVVQ